MFGRLPPDRSTRAQTLMIDYKAIWREVISRFPDDPWGTAIHGKEHWHRVEDVGLKVAHLMESLGKPVDRDVVRLFAVLHDSCRLDDGTDPDHGRRAAEYTKEIRGRLFDLDDTRFEVLRKAIEGHADGYTSKNLTIGACWDSDRMDLRRLGIKPDPSLISLPEMRARL